MNLGYVTCETIALNNLQIRLPDHLLEIIQKRNRGHDELLAIGSRSERTNIRSISVYDRNIERYIPSEEILEDYLENLELRDNSLLLTESAKDFLKLKKGITIAGGIDYFVLWNPADFEKIEKHIKENYPDQIKEFSDQAFSPRFY